jgi:HEAT repeat protein
MALFGKSATLASSLKKVEEGSFRPDELESLLETIRKDLEFELEKNTWLFFHASSKVREFAAAQFRVWAPPGLVDQLIKDMAGKPSTARQEVAKLIAEAAPNRILAHLGSLVHSQAVERREAACDLMATLDRWQDLLPYLKAAIRDHVPSIRQRGARLMTRGLDNPNIFLLLRDLINDEDAVLRRIIIEAFARRPSPDIVEPFFERLQSEDPEERMLILSALSHLARTKQSQVAERVLPMLCDEKQEIREVAAKLLSEMPDRVHVLRAFLVHCRGLAFWLRERSILSLHKVSESLIEPLLKLMRDPDEDIRVGAMLLASGSKDQRFIPLIRDILVSRSEWWIRVNAAEVLNKYPQEEVTEILLSKLQDPDLRYGIISVLASREGAAAQNALLACIEDEKRGVRLAALSALAERKSPAVLSIATRLAEHDADELVRQKAEEVLLLDGEGGQSVIAKIASRRRAQEKQSVSVGELEMVNEELNQKPMGAPAARVP